MEKVIASCLTIINRYVIYINSYRLREERRLYIHIFYCENAGLCEKISNRHWTRHNFEMYAFLIKFMTHIIIS